jgi:proteasome lid subunit RPN8/RPN11
MRTLRLTRDQMDRMQRHIEAEAPLEACGLLAGHAARVESVLEVRNQLHSPVRFVMDPVGQLQAFEWIEARGLDLLGIYHSHPAGPETVSEADIHEAAYPVVHVVWSRLENDEWRARGFWIENGISIEVTLQIV